MFDSDSSLAALGARTFDVIVIGSGAGGSAAAYGLVRAGLDVLLVEKGESLPRDGSTLDVDQVIHAGVFKSREVWRDRAGRPLEPEEHFNVGGKTKWYGAALARFDASEFRAVPERGYLGWPLERADLDMHYDEMERLLGVREVPCEPDLERILSRLAGVSAWTAEALPMGLKAGIERTPVEAMHFDGFASPGGLKADAEVTLLAQIRTAPNFTLLTGRAVAGFVGAPGEPSRITGVRLEGGVEVRAREVVLAAGAMHSPRLIAAYLRDAGLDGLPLARIAGGNFKLHLLTAVLAFAPTRQTDLIRKTRLLTHPALPHSSVQPLGFDGELIATLIPRFVPRRLARLLGAHAYGFFLQTEDGSAPENRVSDDAGAESAPVVDYDERRRPAPAAEHRALVGRFRRDLLRAGYPNFAQRIGLAGTAHACGTLVCGSDPEQAAVDDTGRVYGLTGLSVVDGSVLPRVSRVNPALTIYAFGLRAAAALAERLDRTDDRIDVPRTAMAARR